MLDMHCVAVKGGMLAMPGVQAQRQDIEIDSSQEMADSH